MNRVTTTLRKTFWLLLFGVGLLLVLLYLAAPSHRTSEEEGASELTSQETTSNFDTLVKTIKRSIAPVPEGEKPTSTSDLLSEEEAAARAETLLQHLIKLDPATDRDAIANLLDQIRRIGYPASKPLREMLFQYRDERQVLNLLKALAQIGEADLTDPLKQLMLTNPSKEVRKKARAAFMTRATPEQQGQFLTDSLTAITSSAKTEKSKSDRLYEIEQIVAIGGPEVLATIKQVLVQEKDAGIKQVATESLSELRDPEAANTLLELIVTNPELRDVATAALSKSTVTIDTDEIISTFNRTDDPAVRIALIKVLGSRPSSMATEFLLGLITTSMDETLVRAAGNAIIKASGGKAIPALAEVLKSSPDRKRQRAAAEALSQAGAPAVPVLEGVVMLQSGTARVEALRALGTMRINDAFLALSRTLADWRVMDDPESQRELFNALRQYNQPEVVPNLERVVQKAADESVRRSALELAAELKKGEELPFILETFQRDTSDTVKRGALRLMRKYVDRETVAALRLDLTYATTPQMKDEIQKTIEDIEARLRQ